MDPLAHRLANHLVGNLAATPTLEITGAGVEIELLQDLVLAIAGGDLGASVEGAERPPLSITAVRAGDRLRFGQRRAGARSYLAVSGGLNVAPVLGSAATDLGAALGGLAGRPLRAGDEIGRGTSGIPAETVLAARGRLSPLAATCGSLSLWLPTAARLTRLRAVPEGDPLLSEARQLLFSGQTTFRLSARSGRTGYRFEGRPLPAVTDPDRLSEPTAPGAIQLPPDGLPILLTADRNPTGGYPRLGHLARADLSPAAQLWPGDEVNFQPLGLEESVSAARALELAFRSALAAYATW